MATRIVIGCEHVEPNNTVMYGGVCLGLLTRRDVGKVGEKELITYLSGKMKKCDERESCQQCILVRWTANNSRIRGLI